MTFNGRILVVDDEFPTREICTDLLSEQGYSVENAANGREAMARMEQKPFEIILSDIQMPEMDGVSLLKESRRLHPETEVILMTAYGGLPTAVEAIRFGAYDYLTKPISRETLVKTVHRCLEKIDLNRKLKESQLKLVEQEKLAALGSVSAWLSHKMRNSLSVILMCAHYLQQKAATAENDTREVIAAVIDKVRILDAITSDLIHYSKRVELQKTEEDLNRVIEDVLQPLLVQIQFQGLELKRELEPRLLPVGCDAHILHEAFENVFLNALQAIGQQPGQTLTVRTEVLPDSSPEIAALKRQNPSLNLQDRAANWVRVTVLNTGSLIAPENLDKIFTPFFTTKENGSGLGLSIVRKIVEEHGGAVYAESGERGGVKQTAIRMVFPAAADSGSGRG